MDIIVTSPAFEHGESIPRQYTCSGDGISPPLSWTSAGDNVGSYAIICEDPDAPTGTFTHWVLYDLPPTIHELAEKMPNEDYLSNGGVHGINSVRRTGYMGPCPPSGVHHYYFKVYALDKKLGLKPGAGKKELQDAMKGHILGQGQLMGTYARH